MAVRAAHGRAKELGRSVVVEVLPPNELPAGIPDHSRVEQPTDRGSGGRFAPGNSLAGHGGRGKAGKTRLANRLSIKRLPDDAEFSPYQRAAAAWRRAQCSTLAKTVGAGVCGPGPSSLIATAALALAWSRFLSDQARLTADGDMAQRAINFGKESRASLLAAHELCAREAQARPDPDHDKLHKAQLAFQRQLAEGGK